MLDAPGGATTFDDLYESEATFDAVYERISEILVAAALEHPVFQNAAAAQRVHREYPVILPLEGNRVFEGVIDLAYFDGDRWTVVDFKTDAGLGAKRKAYERQLQWYAHALHVIHGTPVRAVLLAL